jgi:hypothetical protein
MIWWQERSISGFAALLGLSAPLIAFAVLRV